MREILNVTACHHRAEEAGASEGNTASQSHQRRYGCAQLPREDVVTSVRCMCMMRSVEKEKVLRGVHLHYTCHIFSIIVRKLQKVLSPTLTLVLIEKPPKTQQVKKPYSLA